MPIAFRWAMMAGVLATSMSRAQAPARPPDPDRFKPTTLPVIHDPSTVVKSNGMYYVFGTGKGITVLSSPDSVTWTRQPSVFQTIPESVRAKVPLNNGTDVWAPDIVKVGGLFYLYYSVSKWDSFVSAVALATNPTLDPHDPAFHWTDRGVVVASDGVEDLNAIDPGVLSAPDGTLWLCYGSYHGAIKLIQLDPRTGLRIAPRSPVSVIATGSEASDLIYREGFYYLFVNHGSCCQGRNSSYTIRVGRSRTVTGPYVDRYGEALTRAPGNLFLSAHDHRIGPGHFGRLIEDGVERFSLHYEADLTNNARPTLDLRPLLWTSDGWPIAGDHLAEGVVQLASRRTENILEVATKSGALEMARAVGTDTQRWTIAPVAGGFAKIVNLATGEALGASNTAAFTGADSQLWKLDQFPDGTYRIRNKASGLVLAAAAEGSGIAVEAFVADDRHNWVLMAP